MAYHKLIVKFSKKGLMRYISHLDLMRLFSRSLRIAGVPIALTKGYNPHPKISFDRALKLGAESNDEKAIFWMNSSSEPIKFKRLMNSILPEGLRINEAYLESGDN